MNIKFRALIIILILALSAGLAAGSAARRCSEAVFIPDEKIPLLTVMYHSFSPDTAKCGQYVITPDTFESDVKYLLSNGYGFVDTRDITAYCKSGSPLPEKPVMITIDDGHYSCYHYIFPIMKKYGVKAVIAPIAAESDKYSDSMDLNPAYSNMCWDNIKEMYDTGLGDIQNHSYDMHRTDSHTRGCARLKGEAADTYRQRLYADLKKADDAIYAATGNRPCAMLYPFGLTSKEAGEVIDRLGYTVTVSCTEGITLLSRDAKSLRMIKRYNRPHGRSSEEFFKEKDRLPVQ